LLKEITTTSNWYKQASNLEYFDCQANILPHTLTNAHKSKASSSFSKQSGKPILGCLCITQAPESSKNLPGAGLVTPRREITEPKIPQYLNTTNTVGNLLSQLTLGTHWITTG